MSAPRPWAPSGGAIASGERGQPSYYLARWWSRVGAVLLDGLLLTPLNIALLGGFHQYTVTHETNANGSTFTWVHTESYWLPALVYLVYSVVLLSRQGEHNGQTLGKQVLGLRVVRNDGQPVDMRTAAVREGLIKTLPGLLGTFDPLLALLALLMAFIDYLWPLPDGENRAIHDLVAATHVVQTKQQPVFTPGGAEAAMVAPSSAGGPLGTPTSGNTTLAELAPGRSGYLALRDIARDAAGTCWIDPIAHVCSSPDEVHVVRVSDAPEGLFVTMPRIYEPLLSEPSAGSQHAGLKRAILSLS